PAHRKQFGGRRTLVRRPFSRVPAAICNFYTTSPGQTFLIIRYFNQLSQFRVIFQTSASESVSVLIRIQRCQRAAATLTQGGAYRTALFPPKFEQPKVWLCKQAKRQHARSQTRRHDQRVPSFAHDPAGIAVAIAGHGGRRPAPGIADLAAMGVSGEHEPRSSGQFGEGVRTVTENDLSPSQRLHGRLDFIRPGVTGEVVIEPSDCKRTRARSAVGEYDHAKLLQFLSHLRDIAPMIVVAGYREDT